MAPCTLPRRVASRSFAWCLGLASLLVFAPGCSDGDDNSAAPRIGSAPEPTIGAASSLPGVVVTIDRVRGGSGPRGNVRPGDVLAVDFTAKTSAGAPLELTTMARGAIMVSGPTANYQRVIAAQADVLTRATKRALGAYRYKFTVPVPATYLAPLNDTEAITEGEMTGQPLVAGTYTVGIELRKDYAIDGELLRDPGNASFDFLLGDADTLAAREVVTLANCNQCHTELRAHGDNRNQITNCLLCHTSGAEDRNTATVAGGTPGVAIDFKVMIHKIHAGKHLPSVLGVTTNPDGSRDYGAAPQPYQLLGFGDRAIDFSHVNFPAWPSFYTPMPRDLGHAALNTPVTTEGARRQSLENLMRQAPVECAKCHGDPDGEGPLPAPRDGDLIWQQPTIGACRSCHDDWVPEHLYTANDQTMPIQRDNAACKECHRESGTALDLRDAHRHPLTDPALAAGVKFVVTSVTDADGNANGRFEAGERMSITFRVENDAGEPIAASSLSRIEAVLSGPTTNPQMVHNLRIPTGGLTGTGPYTIHMPALVFYEPFGTSDGAIPNQSWPTARAPHWHPVSGATTSLLRVTALSTGTTLAAAAPATQNYIDVAAGTGSQFAKDDYVLVDGASPTRREYLKVQWVSGDRLWFGSQFRTTYKPNLGSTHLAGATVQEATVATVTASAFQIAPETGIVTEVGEIGAGELLASYTTDFVVPDLYPGALDDSPVNGEDWGDWTGLRLLDGTYLFDVHGARTFNVTRSGETTGYTEGADATVVPLLFGAATTVERIERTAGAATCYSCHENLQFHGGSRRGFDTCISCHGTAGAENTLVYENQATGNPLGTTVEFRHFIHRAHDGFFPGMPGGVQDCAKCHGPSATAWTEPATRLHPDQTIATRAWMVACTSCHDDAPARAHIDINTTPLGSESCAVCHGTGEDLDVRTVHRIR
jgi:hypothetical protein